MKQSISTLILLFTLSFFVAFVVVLFLVFYFDSSKSVHGGSLLMSPKALNQESFKTKSGRRLRFSLSRIEYITVNRYGRGWGRYFVSMEGYKRFYENVRKHRSESVVSPELVDQFALVNPSSLTIFVVSRDNQEGEPTVFQQIEFLEDDFRVQVVGEDPTQVTWFYFHAPGISWKANEWFTGQQLSFSRDGWFDRRSDDGLPMCDLSEQRAA